MKCPHKAQFVYPNFSGSGIESEGYQEYAHHSGQIVTVLKEVSNAFSDAYGNDARGYLIRADDGWEGTVWPGELRIPTPERPERKED